MARTTIAVVRVLLDTNILVSGLMYRGNERSVLDHARNGSYDLVLSPHILRELASVMQRRFRWTVADVAENDDDLRAIAIVINPPPVATGITGHVPDDLILDCVAAANADFLVTGDRQHLLPIRKYANARIVTAAEFLEELERADAQDGYSTR